jgi:hypothetical protein
MHRGASASGTKHFEIQPYPIMKHWDEIWSELRIALSEQPRCDTHPDLPCVRTLVQHEVNDILRVDSDGVQVRSHRTGNVDVIPAAALKAWWNHLQEHGTAALSTKDPNCPRTNRSVLTGAILARCLPDTITVENRHLKLRSIHFREIPLPEEVEGGTGLTEGAIRTVVINAYERDARARRECIAAHGTDCCVCGFSFGSVYGPVADGYIHVHHLRPLSELGEEHAVDPVEDLRPICPNCHAVAHLRTPPFKIDEVRRFLSRRSVK